MENDDEELEALQDVDLNTLEAANIHIDVVSVAEMKTAEELAINSGVSERQLMERAGTGVADVIVKHFSNAYKIIVFTGLGGNGGDGYVAARLLAQRGLDVCVVSVGDHESMTGVAKEARDAWRDASKANKIMPLSELTDDWLMSADLVIDAIFGTGLSRDVSEELSDLFERINCLAERKVSVDIPSGVNADTGQCMPNAVEADATATFFRPKIGHLMDPGKMCTGVLHLVNDIGIDDRVLIQQEHAKRLVTVGLPLNTLTLNGYFANQHKYDRGHVVVISGGRYTTGASRLAALGAAKSGAGLVTIAGKTTALDVHANHVTSIMLRPYNRIQDLQKLLYEEMKVDSIVVGPGLGENAKQITRAIIELQMPTVFDADSLTAFEKDPSELLDHLHNQMIITPHAGEFNRLFPGFDLQKDKFGAASSAIEQTKAIMILKGPQTIIARSNPKATLISDHAPPWLATAGSGDLLAGIAGSLLARGVNAFEAGGTAAWLHGEAGFVSGGGSTAEDFVNGIGKAYQTLTASYPESWHEEFDDMDVSDLKSTDNETDA